MHAIPPPKEGCASFLVGEEAVEIRLPAVGFWAARRGLAFSLLAMSFSLTLTGVGAWLASKGAARDAASIAFFVIFVSFGALMTILTTHMFLWMLAAGRRTAEIVVSRTNLTLTIRGSFRSAAYHWRRDQLRGFDADLHGLWIFGDRRPKRFLPERPLTDLRWLAQVLAESLDLPSREPLRPQEIEVYVCFEGKNAPQTFSGMFGYSTIAASAVPEKVQQARLAVGPGRMTLRLAANRLYAMRFFQPRRTWWGLPEWMRALHLGLSQLVPLEEDAIVWQECEGVTCLKIVAPYPVDVSLRIWSEDAQSLIDAVDRFWPPEAE